MLLFSSYVLALVAICLAWPVPLALSRARWTLRSPISALLLWQTIALSGGWSLIGALALWGLAPTGETLVSALRNTSAALIEQPAKNWSNTLDGLHVFALSAAALLLAHLVFSLILTMVRIGQHRAKHRLLIELLSSPGHRDGTVLIEHSLPIAYCIPGGGIPGSGAAVTVLSKGLVQSLDAKEINAVLAHERAHLRQRHHLLLLAFTAWRAALPWFPTSQLAQNSVSNLVEVLADDAAMEEVPALDLRRAIARVAAGQNEMSRETPGLNIDSFGAAVDHESHGRATSSSVVLTRLQRLARPPRPLGRWQRYGVIALCLALFLGPTALVLLPTLLTGSPS